MWTLILTACHLALGAGLGAAPKREAGYYQQGTHPSGTGGELAWGYRVPGYWQHQEVTEAPVWQHQEATQPPVWQNQEATQPPVWQNQEAKEPPVWKNQEATEAPVWQNQEATQPPVWNNQVVTEPPVWEEPEEDCPAEEEEPEEDEEPGRPVREWQPPVSQEPYQNRGLSWKEPALVRRWEEEHGQHPEARRDAWAGGDLEDHPVVRVWPPDYNWMNPTRYNTHRRDTTISVQKSQSFYLPWLMSTTLASAGKKTDDTEKGLREVFGWSQVSIKYPTKSAKDMAVAAGLYKPENCLPLGLEVFGDRLFVSLPKWKNGIPVTLATVRLDSPSRSPALEPYPDWSWHSMDCKGLISVFRMYVDNCGRLWVLDSGKLDITSSSKAVCPAKIVIFNLHTDEHIITYQIPKKQTPENALLTNIVVDYRDGDCDNPFAYISDVFRYGMIVYSLRSNRSWRIDHPYFFPDPLASKYEIDGIKFRWTDGIFSMALGPVNKETDDRLVYFHPLSSFREFAVPASYLRNETRSPDDDPFKKVGEPRKKSRGHASGSAMDSTGILFYNLISTNAVGCWNSNTGIHNPKSQGVVARDNVALSFPNDLKVSKGDEETVWVLSNKLHKYLYSTLDPSEVNFRVLTAKVKDAIKGTRCEPGIAPPPLRKNRKCKPH